MKTTQNPVIEGIHTQDLFGMFDYNLKLPFDEERDSGICLLYGDNGTGKTTLLRLVFHLLATKPKSGHKTFIAGIPFRRFELKYTTGHIVWAARQAKSLKGSYKMGIDRPNKRSLEIDVVANEDMRVKSGEEPSYQELREFSEALEPLASSLYLLGDDRTVQTDQMQKLPQVGFEPDGRELRRRAGAIRSRRLSDEKRDIETIIQQLLEQSLERAKQALRTRVFHATSRGESSVNKLYSQIIEGVTDMSGPGDQGNEAQRKKLRKRLTDMQDQSEAFSQYEILPKFEASEIVTGIEKAPLGRLPLLKEVLDPYIQSWERRLAALSDVKTLIDTFMEILNEFFYKKEVEFTLKDGVIIRDARGRELGPDTLSSGERQLVLLLCNAVAASGERALFLIDEPEISLNLKWQRKLPDALLRLVSESPVQYIFATHSFEILAKHRDEIVDLSPHET